MVIAGTLFEYLAAFATILLAIALADLAHSVHRLLRARRRVTWDPLPLIAAFWLLLVLLTMFFAIWEWTDLTSITFYGLLWKIAPLFLYFLAASAILPDKVPAEGLDLRAFYLSERRYFLPVLMLGFAIDNAAGVVEHWSFFSTNPLSAGFFMGVTVAVLACLGVMLWREERRVHWIALAVLFGLAHLGFASWIIRGAPALAS